MSRKACTIIGCDKGYYAKGFCQMHYRRNRLYADPLSTKIRHERHGGYGTPEYVSWYAMKSRCLNPSASNYANYGGRGVGVCEAWRESFVTFLHDMGHKPSRQHSLERIDNNGNYEPDNCIWATRCMQNRNQRIRKDNSSGRRGISYSKSSGRWIVRVQSGRKRHYVGNFRLLEDAVIALEAFSAGLK